MAIEMKEAAAEIAPLNPDTPGKATEAVRTKRARSPPLMKPEALDEAPADYEKYREERIKANMERMQKLGLLGLSRDVKSAFSTPNSSPNPKRRVVLPSDGLKKKIDLNPPLPPRRSSRLQNVAPVVYTEGHSKKSHDLAEADSVLIEEGWREEFYSEEHEKLLGPCEAPWTLFVDGYGKDGKRIYAQVKGKTCHQCRQKTMGYRTSCCKCQLVQGQFCGDCLYMRYGENVLEAIQNPNWICPACRGICNCSLCRLKKGWNPTGPLYKRVMNLGYKSVAHYLIQTRRKPDNSGEGREATSSATKAAMSDNTEVAKENQPIPEIISEKSDESMIVVAKENQPIPEIISEKSDESMIVVSSDGSGAMNGGESTAKRRVKREKGEAHCGSFAPGSIASRLRSRQKKA